MEQEIWKDVPGYERIYQVSDLGNVRSLNYNRTGKSKLLKQSTVKGYKQVTFCKNGKTKTCWVHVLVAMVFLGHTPCGHLIEVDHINEVKTENRLSNLQLLTGRENIIKSIKRDLPTGVYYIKNKNKYRAQIRINKELKYLGHFNTPEEASAAYQKALSESRRNP